jgi:hypothetical protein
MALIVENGTKPAGANSYVTLAEADAYHALYGNTDWPQPVAPAIPLTPTPDEIAAEEARAALLEPALILATQSLDLLYGHKYASCSVPNSTQALLFPRYTFYDRFGRIVNENTIPKSLKDAQCEIALLSFLGEDIMPLPNDDSNVESQDVTVGDVSTSVTYVTRAQGETYPGFNKVDKLLYPILKDAPGVVRFAA